MSVRHRVALAAVVAVTALAGCTPGGAPSPSPDAPTGGASPTLSPTALPTGSPTSSPAPTGQAITILSPRGGDTVSVPFAVSGESDTFESALTIDAVDASGMVACVRQLTATSGGGTPGVWQGVLAFPPEENPLPLSLRAYTYSQVDGSMTGLVEFPITVAPDRPLIIMTSPRCGDVYAPGGLVMLTGTAALFEAALTIELRDSSGTALITVPVTAEECCVESQFSSALTLPADLASAFYDVVAYSLNAADGSVENEFSVQIEVRS